MFRDIHQLRNAPEYGMIAIEGLLHAESLLDESLRYVPFCKEHYQVWSSQFGRIILECASQIDSLWKAVANQLVPANAHQRLTIKDHYNHFGSLVAKQSVVFFGGASPLVLTPFSAWQGRHFTSPCWWESYNRLKHDRFSNQTDATLEHAVSVVGSLLLAIIYSGACDLALIAAKTLDSSKYNPWAFTQTGLLRDVPFECHSKIETKLFAHPIGIFGVTNCNLSNWWDSGSPRFNMWWALNADKFTTTTVAAPPANTT